MRLFEIQPLLEGKLKYITTQEAKDRGLFGPVYHGTEPETLEKIKAGGFKVIKGERGEEGVRHGYNELNYTASEYPPPIHHLGFGAYFTTVKAIGKMFNNNSLKGLRQYYLNIPNLETINFASPRKMMEWWIANGYDIAKGDRFKATEKLTRTLASQYDAVWFKGKSMYKTLDGDQICVYRPAGKIFMIDDSQVGGHNIGSVVTPEMWVPPRYEGRSYDYFIPDEKVKGMIVAKNAIPYDRLDPERVALMKLDPNKDKHWVSVKWSRGGTHSHYTEQDLIPLRP